MQTRSPLTWPSHITLHLNATLFQACLLLQYSLHVDWHVAVLQVWFQDSLIYTPSFEGSA